MRLEDAPNKTGHCVGILTKYVRNLMNMKQTCDFFIVIKRKEKNSQTFGLIGRFGGHRLNSHRQRLRGLISIVRADEVLLFFSNVLVPLRTVKGGRKSLLTS